jgi:hypothetical protein
VNVVRDGMLAQRVSPDDAPDMPDTATDGTEQRSVDLGVGGTSVMAFERYRTLLPG